MFTTMTRVPKFTFHSTATNLWVTDYFETSAANDPKMILNTKRSIVPIYVTAYMGTMVSLESQISLRFALRLIFFFELQVILRQVYRMTPKWPSTLKGQRYHYIHVRTTHEFIPFPSMANRFRVTDHFKTSARNDSKMILNTKRSKVPPYIYMVHLPSSP